MWRNACILQKALDFVFPVNWMRFKGNRIEFWKSSKIFLRCFFIEYLSPEKMSMFLVVFIRLKFLSTTKNQFRKYEWMFAYECLFRIVIGEIWNYWQINYLGRPKSTLTMADKIKNDPLLVRTVRWVLLLGFVFKGYPNCFSRNFFMFCGESFINTRSISKLSKS